MNLGLAAAGGGAVGAWLRWRLSQWAFQLPWTTSAGERFTLGTVGANLSGCLVIGLLVGWLAQRPDVSPALQTFLLVGVLGGYTTFSTFAWESLRLLEGGHWGLALGNTFGCPALGVLGVWAGIGLTRSLAA